MRFEQVEKLLLRHDAGQPSLDFAVFDDDEGGNRGDFESGRRFVGVVDIDFVYY